MRSEMRRLEDAGMRGLEKRRDRVGDAEKANPKMNKKVKNMEEGKAALTTLPFSSDEDNGAHLRAPVNSPADSATLASSRASAEATSQYFKPFPRLSGQLPHRPAIGHGQVTYDDDDDEWVHISKDEAGMDGDSRDGGVNKASDLVFLDSEDEADFVRLVEGPAVEAARQR